MSSYVGMTMVKKEQRQDDYFNEAYFSHFTSLHKCYILIVRRIMIMLASNMRRILC